jgi:hypothetical protein
MISSVYQPSSDETRTFLDIQIPNWSTSLASCSSDTFHVRHRDLANFEVHRGAVGWQFLKVGTELGEEWKNITGMTPVVDGANFKDSYARNSASGDALLGDYSSGA